VIVRHSLGESAEIARSEGLVSWPRLSPTGDSLAAAVCRPQPTRGTLCRVSFYDFDRGTWTAIGPPDRWSAYPAWDDDGASLVVTERTAQIQRSLVRHWFSPGTEPRTLMTKEEGWILPVGTASDGRLIFSQDDGSGRGQVRVLTPGGAPLPLLDDRFSAFATDVSADGRWLIFDSDRSGRFEVYAFDLETPGAAPIQLTAGGGRFGELAPSDAILYWRASSYPGRAEILRAKVDLDDGRLGEVGRIATTDSVNTSAWYPLGGMAADDEGVLVCEFGAAGAGGRLVLVRNWVADMRSRFERN
jgi:Tol biopolymer transport system component